MNAENKPVTIKSIAKELGVSFSTVSKALNGNPAIREETRKMVTAKAQEMGYRPNSLAKGLRGDSTKTIAVIFNDIENPSLTFIFRNISIHMARYGYTTMIFDSQFQEQTERANILTVLSRQPDFIILEPASGNMENLNLLKGMERKLILQGARYESVSCHHIHVDYFQGGYLSACELLSKGHRDCLILTEPLSFPISTQFVLGIIKAYDEYQIPFHEDHIVTTYSSIQNGFRIMQELWDEEQKKYRLSFTGVLTFNDTLAYGVYKSAAQNGLRIPEDISVIGFDNNPVSAFSDPPLTTIHLPKEKMAESCISILNSVLIENRQDICVFTLVPNLVSRSSVRTPQNEKAALPLYNSQNLKGE